MKYKHLVETFIYEADARIQHAEDIVFWEGSAGAKRAIQALKDMAGDQHKAVTIKWDGSPAIIFGRDEQGNFVFTDKSGFGKKGGVGRATSPDALRTELLGRSGGKDKDNPDRIAFAARMAGAFDAFEKAVPADYRGYFKGDMLYFDTPKVENGHYVFTPQLVTYEVDANSELGKKIGNSTAGIVVHREVDSEGTEGPLKDLSVFQGTDVLVFPPVTAQKPVKVDNSILDKLEAFVNKHSAGIDELFNEQALRQLQLTDLSKIFYTYVNSKVDTSLQGLGEDFPQWLNSLPPTKISERKKARILEYIQQHAQAYNAVWKTVTAIMKAKDFVIAQFDKQDTDVKQHIAGQSGGEGYVLAHPDGDIKLVPREFFSKANRAKGR